MASKGQHRNPESPVRIAVGVFVETTASGLMARVLGPGDVIETRGFWVTDGHLSADSALAPGGLTDAGNRRSRALEIRIDCLAFHSSERRVADLLGAIDSRTPEARIGLTQQQFAELTGLRRATVNEVFQNLQSDGAVSVRRGHIHITNAAGLARASCGCDRLPGITVATGDRKPTTPSDQPGTDHSPVRRPATGRTADSAPDRRLHAGR